MGMPSGPTALPFKSEKLSFSLSYKSTAVTTAQIELSCLCFDREGNVMDYVQFNRKAALNSSLKHSSCSYLPKADAVAADEAIHMYPFDFAPQCEVLLLLCSAPKHALCRNDLGLSGSLRFRVHARELGAEQLQLLDTDLSFFVSQPAAAGAGPLSNGHQTMAIAAVYTTPQGWTLSFDCSTYQEDHWGLLLPELRKLLQRWPTLSAAEHCKNLNKQAMTQHNQQQHLVIDCRKGSDHQVATLASRMWSTRLGSHPCTIGCKDSGVEQAVLPDDNEAGQQYSGDDTPQANSTSGAQPEPSEVKSAAPEPVGTEKLLLQLGWELFKPADEEEEPAAVEFTISVYNLQGEELITVSADNPEAEGLLVEDEEPEDTGDGNEQADEAHEEQDGREDGLSDAELQGDELVRESEGDGDKELQEPDEAAKAAKAAAAAEAAAAAAQAAAANQRPLAERFPLKRKVHLVLPELPAGSRCVVVALSNFTGDGFKNIKSLHARLLLEESQQPEKEGQEEEEEEEEEAEGKAGKVAASSKKGPKSPDRVLMHYRFDSAQGADAHISQILMLKLYKEYPDSAFAVWQQQQVSDVASLLGVTAAAGCELLISDATPCEKAKEVLQQVLAARQQLEKNLADLRAKAEEEGADPDEDEDPDLRLEHGVWRVRVLGASAGGNGPEDMADMLNTLLAYDGDLDSAGKRTCSAAKVAFTNRDTYFGGYEADVKSGLGLYVFSSGAGYVGQYEKGKRQGVGLMMLPDGGLYRGCFADDKFEGQGMYVYPDNSCYTGTWKAGKKHGQGVYWDTASGCLQGNFVAGLLNGQGKYDQLNYHFEGRFVKGLPAGPCNFTVSAFRTVDMPQAAATYISSVYGPTLCAEGTYALPAGADDGVHVDDSDQQVAQDPDHLQLPAHPKYEGLKYQSALGSLPINAPVVQFPPTGAAATAAWRQQGSR